ncbi:lipoprotein [Candidatus Vampirococcus lugosii]|uniref:Lipoprotein n=1 Tax=Candidatus Vampirococcus lugosii TaxID=2789015 RepID=A0ABS5QNA1_9BACT|nr:lipoprotein [Candidatus Vampirococcus lugosii]MBS8122151.1 hypothetical protein [Candidatus Vampirococcus lugosii]
MKKIILLITLTLILSACNQEESGKVKDESNHDLNVENEKSEEKVSQYTEEDKIDEEGKTKIIDEEVKVIEEENKENLMKIDFEVKELVDYNNCIIDKEKFEILKENTDIFNYDDFCIPKYQLIGTIKSGEPDQIIVRSCGEDNPYTLQQFNKGDETFVYNISKNNGNLCNNFEFSFFSNGEKIKSENYFLEKNNSLEYVFEEKKDLLDNNGKYYIYCKNNICNEKYYFIFFHNNFIYYDFLLLKEIDHGRNGTEYIIYFEDYKLSINQSFGVSFKMFDLQNNKITFNEQYYKYLFTNNEIEKINNIINKGFNINLIIKNKDIDILNILNKNILRILGDKFENLDENKFNLVKYMSPYNNLLEINYKNENLYINFNLDSNNFKFNDKVSNFYMYESLEPAPGISKIFYIFEKNNIIKYLENAKYNDDYIELDYNKNIRLLPRRYTFKGFMRFSGKC